MYLQWPRGPRLLLKEPKYKDTLSSGNFCEQRKDMLYLYVCIPFLGFIQLAFCKA